MQVFICTCHYKGYCCGTRSSLYSYSNPPFNSVAPSDIIVTLKVWSPNMCHGLSSKHFLWNCSQVNTTVTFEKSTLVQEMAWCRQATSHYLSQCCSRSISPCGIGRGYYVLPSPKWRSLESRLDTFLWISSKQKRDYLKTTTHICSFMLEETTYQISVSLVLWSLRN